MKLPQFMWLHLILTAFTASMVMAESKNDTVMAESKNDTVMAESKNDTVAELFDLDTTGIGAEVPA